VVALIRRLCSAQAAADADPAAIAVFGAEVQVCVGDRLSRRDERHLADAIEHAKPRCGEVSVPAKAGAGADG